jgi:uncharacterized protein
MINSTSRLAAEFWEQGWSRNCPVIDMHGHMGTFRGIYFPRASVDAMIGTMDECGVRMLVFCHHHALFCPEIGNAANVEAVRKYPDRLRAYLAVLPHYPEQTARDLAEFDRHRDVYVGLKMLAGYYGVPWDAPAFEPAWRFANQHRLLVLGHTWSGSNCDGEAMVRKIAVQYPDLKLLCGHSLHGAWKEAIAIAKEFPNVYLELTAVLDDRGPLECFVESGLARKLLFGTDLPWFDQHHGIGAVLSADITDEDRHDILHRNAERLLASVGVKSVGAVTAR